MLSPDDIFRHWVSAKDKSHFNLKYEKLQNGGKSSFETPPWGCPTCPRGSVFEIFGKLFLKILFTYVWRHLKKWSGLLELCSPLTRIDHVSFFFVYSKIEKLQKKIKFLEKLKLRLFENCTNRGFGSRGYLSFPTLLIFSFSSTKEGENFKEACQGTNIPTS